MDRASGELQEAGIMLPVIEAHCEYRSPARYDDELQVKTGSAARSARVESLSITRSAGPADGTVNALGRTMHAAIDNAGKPCRLPDHIRDLFR